MPSFFLPQCGESTTGLDCTHRGGLRATERSAAHLACLMWHPLGMRRKFYPPHEPVSRRPLHRGRTAGTTPTSRCGNERHDAPSSARYSSSGSNSNSSSRPLPRRRCYARVILAAAASAATAQARGFSASMAGAVAFSGWLATARASETALESVLEGSIPIRGTNGGSPGSERRQRQSLIHI